MTKERELTKDTTQGCIYCQQDLPNCRCVSFNEDGSEKDTAPIKKGGPVDYPNKWRR